MVDGSSSGELTFFMVRHVHWTIKFRLVRICWVGSCAFIFHGSLCGRVASSDLSSFLIEGEVVRIRTLSHCVLVRGGRTDQDNFEGYGGDIVLRCATVRL